MTSFSAKNNLNTKKLFEERKKYQFVMDAVNKSETKLLDLWYETPDYGRVNHSGRVVYPAEGFLKPISQRHGEPLYLINFAADMFNDFVDYWSSLQSSKKLHPEGELLVIKPVRAWQNVHLLYHKYMDVLYKAFSRRLFDTKKPRSLEEMIEMLVLFIKDDSRFNLVTKSAFITSKYSDPLVSGLMVEIENFPHGTDNKKGDFFRDPNFLAYKKVAEKFNFKVDENAPWRLIVDIDSPNIQEYLNKYELTKDSVFDELYYEAYEYDVENIKTYMLGYWNQLVEQKMVGKSVAVASSGNETSYLTRKKSQIVIEKTPSDSSPTPTPEPTPEPVFGETFATVPLLIDEIAATPEDYPDGTPAYITTIDYNVPDGSDPISSTGWVIIYGGIPVAQTPPSIDHFQGWIDTYDPPNQVTVWVDDGDSSGFVTNNDGSATPTRNVPVSMCAAFRPMNASSISGGYVDGNSDAFDPADLIDVRYSI